MRIDISTNKYPDTYTLVDDDDFEYLNQWKWCVLKAPKTFYVVRSDPLIYMHREVVHAPKGKVTDHINHDGLDNRKENLRICSIQQNNMNTSSRKGTSKYKGVSWDKATKKWRSFCNLNKKQYYLGSFETEEKAAMAYNKKAKETYGDFANLNNIKQEVS